MTRPAARILQLLTLLQSATTRSRGELADDLGVDERTVRRYVEQLRDLDIRSRASAAGTAAIGSRPDIASRR